MPEICQLTRGHTEDETVACEGVSQLCHCAGRCRRRAHNKHHSRERGVILTGHKMEKTGKHIGRGEGRLLLISCLRTETCFIKTLQPAVSLIFTDRPKDTSRGKRSHFLLFYFYNSSLIANLGGARQAIKAVISLVCLSPYFTLEIQFIQKLHKLEMLIWLQ